MLGHALLAGAMVWLAVHTDRRRAALEAGRHMTLQHASLIVVEGVALGAAVVNALAAVGVDTPPTHPGLLVWTAVFGVLTVFSWRSLRRVLVHGDWVSIAGLGIVGAMTLVLSTTFAVAAFASEHP
jgi:hypothetical protein